MSYYNYHFASYTPLEAINNVYKVEAGRPL